MRLAAGFIAIDPGCVDPVACRSLGPAGPLPSEAGSDGFLPWRKASAPPASQSPNNRPGAPKMLKDHKDWRPEFDGIPLEILQVGGEPCLSAEDLGAALELGPPEEGALAVYRRHSAEFAPGMSLRVPLDTPAGPRQARVFNLLGAYAVAALADSPSAPRFRLWVLSALSEWLCGLAAHVAGQDQKIRAIGEQCQALTAQAAAARLQMLGKDQALEELRQRVRAVERQLLAQARLIAEIESLPAPQAALLQQQRRIAALEQALEARRDELRGAVRAASAAKSAEAALQDFLDFQLGHHFAQQDAKNAAGLRALREAMAEEARQGAAPAIEAALESLAEAAALLQKQQQEILSVGHAAEAAAPGAGQAQSVFSFEGREVRTLDVEGEIWFVAVDVCAVLDLPNATKALLRLDGDEKQVIDFETLNTIQGISNQGLINFNPKPLNIINEFGLYSLILTSRKPEAKRFKKWVTSEVLPAVRKAGGYRAAPAQPPQAAGGPDALPENEWVEIPFCGQSLLSLQREGEIYVAMKPIVEAMGLNWKSQHARIQRHEILKTCVVMTTMQMPGDDQRREVLALPLKCLNGWLFGIDASRVRPEIKDAILAYQRECYDVLWQHWSAGRQARIAGLEAALAKHAAGSAALGQASPAPKTQGDPG